MQPTSGQSEWVERIYVSIWLVEPWSCASPSVTFGTDFPLYGISINSAWRSRARRSDCPVISMKEQTCIGVGIAGYVNTSRQRPSHLLQNQVNFDLKGGLKTGLYWLNSGKPPKTLMQKPTGEKRAVSSYWSSAQICGILSLRCRVFSALLMVTQRMLCLEEALCYLLCCVIRPVSACFPQLLYKPLQSALSHSTVLVSPSSHPASHRLPQSF